MKAAPTLIDERWRHGDRVLDYAQARPAGALAAGVWLAARRLVAPDARWEISIALDVAAVEAPARFRDTADSRFHIAIAWSEWGFYFCHHSRASWIRVTDIPFIHERDDYGLLPRVPPLRELGKLMGAIEQRFRFRFRRAHATIRSTIPGAEPAVRAWLEAL